MPGVSWTEEQALAINITDKNLLISASAGSGKTAVLVERIIKRIRNKEIQTDELLAITFTKAAAGELKQRIRSALRQEIVNSSDEDAEYYSIQQEKLDSANISTLHSFCYGIIKKYYHLISVDPQVRIMSDEEKSILYSDSIDLLFEEYYENDDGLFLEFIDTFSSYSDDENIKQTIISSYEELRNIAGYKDELKRFAESYPENEDDFSSSPASEFILSECGKILAEARRKYVMAMDIARQEDDEKMLVTDNLASIIEAIDLLEKKRNCSFREFLDAVWSTPIPDASRKKINRKEEIKYYRDGGKKILNELKKYVPFDFETALYYTTSMKPYVLKFCEMILEFEKILDSKKREKKMVDYSDLEHLCLAVLENDAARSEIKDSFRQVLVDEYQDINGVQEMIIKNVSGDSNLFMVGDIKQSIYRFRQADPGIFYDKYVNFRTASEDDKNKLIHIGRNFRSSKIIIDFVNMLFSEIMTKNTGGVDFYPDEMMKAALPVLINEPVHLRMIDCTDIKTDEEIEDNREAEAMYVADLIKNEILQKTYKDELTGQEIRFAQSDIAVLDRSMKAKASYFLKAFEAAGLSANIIDDSKFYDAYEVSLIINYLRLIDNDLNDIALLSVMRSFIYNFSEDDITLIRSKDRESMYYHRAVRSYIDSEDDRISEDLTRMYGDIKRYRALSRHISIRDLIEMICEEKYVLPYLSALPDGDKRLENMQELLSIASEYETSNVKGLYDFIIYADRCKEKMKRKPASEDKDGVRLMTTHSSKGLEFEVVIVTGCATMIKSDSMHSSIFIDKDFGICPKFTDMAIGYRTNTTELTARTRSISLKNKAEEMRILYVAATRARRILYLTAAADKKETLCGVYTEKLGEFELSKASNYLEWIKYAMDMNPQKCGEIYDVNIVKPFGEGGRLVKKDRKNIFTDLSAKEDTEKAIRENYAYIYPYRSSMIPSKLSVSALKDRENISADRLIERRSIIEGITDRQDNKNAMQRGTMIHKILELSDTESLRCGDIDLAINEAIRLGKISPEDVSDEDRRMILGFFRSEVGKMMINSDSLHREQPFILKEKAKNINPEWEKSDDHVLIQGIIDCWFEYGGKIYVADFKTDRIKSDEHLSELNEKYSTQLKYYKTALEIALGRDVECAYICYLRKNIAVKL